MIEITVKDIKEIIKDLPDDVQITYQRIEDVYFEKHGWKSEKVKCDIFPEDKDEFILASTAWFDKDNNKVRISAHF